MDEILRPVGSWFIPLLTGVPLSQWCKNSSSHSRAFLDKLKATNKAHVLGDRDTSRVGLIYFLGWTILVVKQTDQPCLGHCTPEVRGGFKAPVYWAAVEVLVSSYTPSMGFRCSLSLGQANPRNTCLLSAILFCGFQFAFGLP